MRHYSILLASTLLLAPIISFAQTQQPQMQQPQMQMQPQMQTQQPQMQMQPQMQNQGQNPAGSTMGRPTPSGTVLPGSPTNNKPVILRPAPRQLHSGGSNPVQPVGSTPTTQSPY